MSVKYLWRTIVPLVLGCSSNPVDVGSYDVGDNMLDWTDEKTCAAGRQLPIVGNWTGFAEESTPGSGWTAMRLVISHASGRRACGTVTLGTEAPPWPPVTISDAPYPPELSNTPHMSFKEYLARLEGIPLTIAGSSVGLPNVSFLASYAQWKDWCAMQTPYRCEDVADKLYYCIPVSGSGGLTPRITHTPSGECVTVYDGEEQVVDCGKAVLCLDGPCECTQNQCGGPPRRGYRYELTFRGNEATGTVEAYPSEGEDAPRSEVHLTKER